ncbi:aspartate kinase [Aquimarina pacifica]|uniref:aspartate kinase n=1 Tax=Aquimarina pacifica TaxID=1296415 RepID=UPI00046F4418|nr:aspartate kinase [Aquimarina pacifica]
MRVFKFGGASVKDADGVKNVIKVLHQTGFDKLVIVVSAMGKTTNALEKIVTSYLNNDPICSQQVQDLKTYHISIITQLFRSPQHPIFEHINDWFFDLETFFSKNESKQYEYVYDQIVPYGELISTTIVSTYLNYKGYKNEWVDARHIIKTDIGYRDAEILWKETQDHINSKINKNGLSVTQGFIGGYGDSTTTLGREGSDYTAGILGYCLDATSVSIWKDVPGILNADPRTFKNTQLLSHISYSEAIELAFYGASIIHPKTIQPLQRKEIPLYVKSFLNPNESGTSVKKGQPLDPHLPCYIVKKNQILLSLSSLDFSFIVEENISQIFSLFHEYHIKVTLIQNSAISFSVCLDDPFSHFEQLLNILSKRYRVVYNTNVSLFTIRHFTSQAIKQLEKDKTILVKQTTRETYQIVSKD